MIYMRWGPGPCQKVVVDEVETVRPDRYSNLMIETEFAAKINYFSILVVNVELLIQLFVDVLLFVQYITHSKVLLYYIVPGMYFPGLYLILLETKECWTLKHFYSQSTFVYI